MRFPTMWYVRPAYTQSDQSLCLLLEYSMIVKLLTEHHLEFLSLKGGCTGSSESDTCQNDTLLEITCHGFELVFCLRMHFLSEQFCSAAHKEFIQLFFF